MSWRFAKTPGRSQTFKFGIDNRCLDIIFAVSMGLNGLSRPDKYSDACRRESRAREEEVEKELKELGQRACEMERQIASSKAKVSSRYDYFVVLAVCAHSCALLCHPALKSVFSLPDPGFEYAMAQQKAAGEGEEGRREEERGGLTRSALLRELVSVDFGARLFPQSPTPSRPPCCILSVSSLHFLRSNLQSLSPSRLALIRSPVLPDPQPLHDSSLSHRDKAWKDSSRIGPGSPRVRQLPIKSSTERDAALHSLQAVGSRSSTSPQLSAAPSASPTGSVCGA